MEYKPPRRAQKHPVTVICAMPAGVEADTLIGILLDSANIGDALAALDGEGSSPLTRRTRFHGSGAWRRSRQLRSLYRSLAAERARR